MKAILAGILMATLVLAAAADAEWLIQKERIDTCFDTDGGLNYLTQGELRVTRHNKALNVSDYCIDSSTIAEYACGSDIPGVNSKWAVLAGENCTAVSPGSVCMSGRCVNQSQPDLVVTMLNATFAGNSTNQTAYRFYAIVRNMGSSSAASSVTRFQVSPTGLVDIQSTQSLAPGQEVTVVTSVFYLSPGIYNVTASADWYNSVAESNENNNDRTERFTA